MIQRAQQVTVRFAERLAARINPVVPASLLKPPPENLCVFAFRTVFFGVAHRQTRRERLLGTACLCWEAEQCLEQDATDRDAFGHTGNVRSCSTSCRRCAQKPRNNHEDDEDKQPQYRS